MGIEAAIKLACEAHNGQTDKGGAPYILHPLRVMMAMGTDQERIVAVLHDVVEDSDYSLVDIDAMFGPRTAAAVDCLTKRGGEDYDMYLSRVESNPLAAAVKIADLEDNSDLSRLGRDATLADLERSAKYHGALARLSRSLV